VASTPPQWPGIEIGFVGHQGIGLSGIYYDFFEIPEGKSYGIIVGEGLVKGAEGVIYTGVLRGMVRALCRLTTQPVELVTILNDIILRDSMQQTFILNYLVLTPHSNQLHYLNCGHGNLWQIPSGSKAPLKITTSNALLGEAAHNEFTEKTIPWNVGDTLLLNTFTLGKGSIEHNFSDALFESTLTEMIERQPQKQVEAILRKARVVANKWLQERSIALVSILRKE
jgi:serine phosphatase RsbU (regulator of sigma subunit)